MTNVKMTRFEYRVDLIKGIHVTVRRWNQYCEHRMSEWVNRV